MNNITAIIAIRVNRPTGIPFILVASDSKRSTTNNPTDRVLIADIEEDAKKIFKINNKFIAMSGSFRPPFQSSLIQRAKENSKKCTSIVDFTEIIIESVNEYMEIEEENSTLVIIGGMIFNSNPVISIHTSIKEKQFVSTEYFNSKNHVIELVFGGERPPELLKGKYSNMMLYGKLTPIEVRKVAQQYINDMANFFPDTCNKIMQSELIM